VRGAEDSPGSIDNSILMDPLLPNTCKKSLLEKYDFEIVSSKTWQLFCSWYGGGPALPRKVISSGWRDSLMVEIRHLRLKISRSVSTMSQLTVSYSRAATVGRLKTEVCAKLGIDPAYIQLWDFHARTKIKVLNNMLETLDDAQIIDGQEILFEDLPASVVRPLPVKIDSIDSGKCRLDQQCLHCQLPDIKLQDHVYNRHNICINCGTTKHCKHNMVLKTTEVTDLGCRKVEMCTLCDKVVCGPVLHHTFVHTLTKDGFVNVPDSKNSCHKLECCSTCKFERYVDKVEHKMFRQVCILCGTVHKECKPCLCDGGSHFSAGVFSYLHKFSPEGTCERCHIICSHINKTLSKSWTTKDDKTCFPTSVCDQCVVMLPHSDPSPHTWQNDVCIDCGYKTPPHLKIIRDTKKACLALVEDCFTNLEAEVSVKTK